MKNAARRYFLWTAGLAGLLAFGCATPPAASRATRPAGHEVYGAHVGRARYVPNDYKAPVERVQFIVYGDRNGGEEPGFMEQGIALANLLRPEFILSVGDEIPGYVTAGKGKTAEQAHDEVLAQWREFDALVRKFQVPYFYVVGNHDITNKPAGEIYTELHGPRYYSFDAGRGAGRVHIIVLNSEEYVMVGGKGSLGEAQIAWLEQDLAKSKDASLTAISLHNPVWHNAQRNDWAKVDELLAGRNAIVFAGHEHEYSYEVRRGIPYVIVAAVAGSLDEEADEVLGAFRHVTVVTVEDGKPHVALVKLGSALPVDVAPLATRQHIEKIRDVSRLDYLPAEPRVDQPITIVWDLENSQGTPAAIKGAWHKGCAWQVEPAEFAATLAPNERRKVEFAGKVLLKDATEPPTIEVALSWPGAEVPAAHLNWQASPLRRIEAVKVAAIEVDGRVDDAWSDARPASLDSASQFGKGFVNWTGPKDFSARVRAATDGAKVYLLAEVTDDDVQMDKDQLTFGVAPAVPDKVVTAAVRSFYRFKVLPPKADGQVPVRWTAKGRLEAKAAACRTQAGWTVEVAVDVTPLVKDASGGVAVPFDFVIDDVDAGEAQATEAYWCGGSDSLRTTRQWGQLSIPAAAVEAARAAASQEAASTSPE